MTHHPQALWAMAWRARAAAWLLRNRRHLERPHMKTADASSR